MSSVGWTRHGGWRAHATKACLKIDLVAGRGELTVAAWEWIGPLLPQVDGRGRPWREHRQVVNGVLWRLRTGAPWRDLPERYGSWQTVYERFARWEADGTWARLLEHVQVRDDTEGRVEWTVAVDGRGLPLSIVLTPGNLNDATAFGQVLDGIRVPTPAAHARNRPESWATRPTPARRSGICCGVGASPSRSPSAATKPPTADAEGASAAGRPPSTRSSTATATWSNDASHASSSSARSRRDSTSWPTATVPASSWPRRSSGSANQPVIICQTLPRTVWPSRTRPRRSRPAQPVRCGRTGRPPCRPRPPGAPCRRAA